MSLTRAYLLRNFPKKSMVLYGMNSLKIRSRQFFKTDHRAIFGLHQYMHTQNKYLKKMLPM